MVASAADSTRDGSEGNDSEDSRARIAARRPACLRRLSRAPAGAGRGGHRLRALDSRCDLPDEPLGRGVALPEEEARLRLPRAVHRRGGAAARGARRLGEALGAGRRPAALPPRAPRGAGPPPRPRARPRHLQGVLRRRRRAAGALPLRRAPLRVLAHARLAAGGHRQRGGARAGRAARRGAPGGQRLLRAGAAGAGGAGRGVPRLQDARARPGPPGGGQRHQSRRAAPVLFRWPAAARRARRGAAAGAGGRARLRRRRGAAGPEQAGRGPPGVPAARRRRRRPPLRRGAPADVAGGRHRVARAGARPGGLAAAAARPQRHRPVGRGGGAGAEG